MTYISAVPHDAWHVCIKKYVNVQTHTSFGIAAFLAANEWKTVFSYGRLESLFPGVVRWEWDLDFGGVGGCGGGSAVKNMFD